MGETAKVTDAELAVLQLLWDQGAASVRQLTDALYPGGGASEYGTVHKLLERLEGKGCVRRKRGEGAYLYQPAIGRDELIGRELEELVDKMCGGSLQPLLSNLVRIKGLTAAEIDELRAFVAKMGREQRSERGRSRKGGR